MLSPTNTFGPVCHFQSNNLVAAVTTTMARFRPTTKRNSGRARDTFLHEEVAQGWDCITHMAVLQDIPILLSIITVIKGTSNSERGDAA